MATAGRKQTRAPYRRRTSAQAKVRVNGSATEVLKRYGLNERAQTTSGTIPLAVAVLSGEHATEQNEKQIREVARHLQSARAAVEQAAALVEGLNNVSLPLGVVRPLQPKSSVRCSLDSAAELAVGTVKAMDSRSGRWKAAGEIRRRVLRVVLWALSQPTVEWSMLGDFVASGVNQPPAPPANDDQRVKMAGEYVAALVVAFQIEKVWKSAQKNNTQLAREVLKCGLPSQIFDVL